MGQTYRETDGQMDGRQAVTLRLPADVARVTSYCMKKGTRTTPVGDDATTLVFPQRNSSGGVMYDVSGGVHHALPDVT